MSEISKAAGLRDGNVSNLVKTVESSILGPLKDSGYIDSYEKLLNGNDITYRIKRSQIAKSIDEREAGSVKEGGRVGKETRQGR
jgi:hypothetical protein